MRTERLKLISIPFALLLLLTGCWEQELIISLNADGSGEVFARRARKADTEWYGDDRPAKVFSDYPEGAPVRRIRYSRTERDADNMFVEEVSFSFDDLGEAIPILEHEFDCFPQFRYDRDRFVIYLERTRHSFLPSHYRTFNMQCRITMMLPAPPVSEKGMVDGNSLVWNLSEDYQSYREIPIGTILAEASIPADSIKTDIRPRSQRRRLYKQDHSSVTMIGDIPLDGRLACKNNARLLFLTPFPDVPLPASYKDLTLTRLVAGGRDIAATIEGKTSGSYTGDPLRYTVSFDLADPLLSVIDLLEVTLRWIEPAKFAEHTITIEGFPVGGGECFAVAELPGGDGTFVAITKIEYGPPLESLSEQPAITLMTNADPGIFSKLCVNTDYGLRFERDAVIWSAATLRGLENNQRAPAAFKDCGKFYKARVKFEHLPARPFDVVVVTIQETSEREQTIKLEDFKIGAKRE